MRAEHHALALLAAAWAGYFLLHSLTAAQGFKTFVDRRLPWLAPRYRLAYNAVAVITLTVPGAALHGARGQPLWLPAPGLQLVLDGAALAALAAFLVSLRGYDLGRFGGLAAGVRATSDGSSLRLRGFNRFVRHPWYSLGLVLVWTRPMDAAWLLSACAISVYLVIGTWLEERKLVDRFGAAYEQYRQQVPMFVPSPGRYLGTAQARRLEAEAADND